jgi:thioredoxin reductase (NADPH)
MYDIIIIGGGVAGFAAAVYAGRFKMKTLLFTGDFKGGLITWAKDVQNYPGFKNITGMELAKKIEDHAKEYDIEMKSDMVANIVKLDDGSFEVETKKGKFNALSILFATGTKVRTLDVPGEKELKNKGVHYCALCDGYFYADKTVAVIGGSDSAAIEALILKDTAKKVYIIYRKEKIRAEPVNAEHVDKAKNIEIINNTNVTEFLGKDVLKSVKLDKEFNGKDTLELDAAFVSIGHMPQSDLAKGLGVKLDKLGFVKIDKDSKTNVEGFYAAGDVADTKFKQAITGVGEAVAAMYWAFQHVQSKK